MLMFQVTFLLLFQLVLTDHTQPSIHDVIERLMLVENRLKENEKEIYVLRETTAFQKELIEKQEIRIKSQDIKIHHQELKINALEKKIADQNVVIRNYFDKVSNKRKMNELGRRSHVTTDKNYQQKKHFAEKRMCSIAKNNGDISGKAPRQAVGGGIAFTAFLDHDGDYGASQTIVFNKIITNDGNGYNNHTGVFTCPEEGMYLFTFFVGERGVRDGVTQIWADLIINSQNIIDAVAETRHYGVDSQGGNTVVIRLKHGDSVWVRSRGAGYHIQGVETRTTSFTGLYLYP